MTYSEDFLSKVSSFGILGYSVEKIIALCEPENEKQFRIDFNNSESAVYKSYRKGKTTGEYNLDKNLFDKATKEQDTEANTILDGRMDSRKIKDKIFENFEL
ncbi:MAG: hypothetical protein LBN95_06500 [Prevotellaceae bacterium]|jgi:hypothetical protein|nr:hypothetical protein [Prevotellaceae bacterium]